MKPCVPPAVPHAQPQHYFGKGLVAEFLGIVRIMSASAAALDVKPQLREEDLRAKAGSCMLHAAASVKDGHADCHALLASKIELLRSIRRA